MSVESAVPVSSLAPLAPVEAAGPAAQAPEGDLAAGANGSGLPAGVSGVLASVGVQGALAPDTSPWGSSPADELAAGGQVRGLTEMARELARGSHALRGAEDAATAPARQEANGTPVEAALAGQARTEAAAPGAAVLAGVVLGLHPAAGGPLRPPVDEVPGRRPVRWPAEREGHRDAPGEQAPGEDGGSDERASAAASLERAEPVPEAPWSAPLLAALRQTAAAPAARAALQAAAEAWERGRAVLLACPSSGPQAQAAWLFVLRPAPGGRTLRLCGERLPASLRWAHAGTPGRWWCVRVAKSYSLRRGGQLVTQDESADGRVSCELQLGPFPAALPRWTEALVRVDLARRLWQALGTQWSLPLLVCDQALLAIGESALVAREEHA